MAYRYECESWQGMVQQVVLFMSSGYTRYCHLVIPDRKLDQAGRIDRKLIQKYQCDLSKDQRYRRKKKNEANFHYLRWHDLALILQCPGTIGPEILYDDKFSDVLKNPLHLVVSDYLTLKIVKSQQGWTVCMSRDTYREAKAQLFEKIIHVSKSEIMDQYNKLNGLPAWRGIIEQRRRLQEFVISATKRHRGIRLWKKELFNNTHKCPRQVYTAR